MKKILIYFFLLLTSPASAFISDFNLGKKEENPHNALGNVYLTSRAHYNDYLNDPRMSPKALEGLNPKERGDVAEQVFMDHKYKNSKYEVFFELWKNFGVFIFLFTWMVISPLIIRPILRIVVRHAAGNDIKSAFRTYSYYFLRILGAMGGVVYPRLLALDQNKNYDNLLCIPNQNMFMGGDSNRDRLLDLQEIHRKYANKESILAEALSMALFHMLLFFGFTPDWFSLTIATVTAAIGSKPTYSIYIVLLVTLVVLIPKFIKYDLFIIEPIQFLLSSKALKTDLMEAAELLFVRKRAEGVLSKEQVDLIIDTCIDARKNPEKMVYLWNFVSIVVALPSKEEMDNPKGTKLIEDGRVFSYYPEEGQDLARRIAVRCKHGVRMNPILIQGPPGVGKNLFARNLAKEIGAELVILSTAVPIRDLEGEAPSSKGPGQLGAIGEALIQKKKSKCILILLDEIDNALKSKEGRAIRELLLKLLDPTNNGRYYLKYLGGEKNKAAEVALPVVIILNTNESIEEISPPLANRCDNTLFDGYTWQERKEMVFEKPMNLLKKYCSDVGIDIKILVYTDYKEIRNLLDKMEVEDNKKPENKKDYGLRKVDANVKRLLEFIKIDKIENSAPSEKEEKDSENQRKKTII